MHSGKRTRMANGIYPTPTLLFPVLYLFFLYLALSSYRFRDNVPRIRLRVFRNDPWVASL